MLGLISLASVVYFLPNCSAPYDSILWYDNCSVVANGNEYYNENCTLNPGYNGTREERMAVGAYKCQINSVNHTLRFKPKAPGKPDYIIKCPEDRSDCKFTVVLYALRRMKEVAEVGYGTCRERLRALTQCWSGFNVLSFSDAVRLGLEDRFPD